MPFLRLSVFLLLLSVSFASARAQVEASLVAREVAVRPGEPVEVALRLEHAEHWHTYWINAGTGYPTSLEWALPEGWSAGEIRWPVPMVIKDYRGEVTGNGYEGVVLLPVTLTPPADLAAGGEVTLRAKAAWLMCDPRTCVPGDAEVALTLPVRAGVAEPSASANEFAAVRLPAEAAESWQIEAARSGTVVTLTVRGEGGAALAAPHFFSEDAFIAYDKPQRVERTAEGVVMTLPVSEYAEAGTARLVGVLSYGEPREGLAIDVPLAEATAAARAAGSGKDGGGRGLVATLALAVAGGLILNLMPCVFPVLGIKIMGFVRQAGHDRRRVTLHGLAFATGVLVSFWALAGVLAALRAGGERLGWGFQLQSAPFVFVLTVVMLVFAMAMSGVFEFGLRATAAGAGLQAKEGLGGSFFTGVLATVVATPCSAPFLAPALGAALALPPGASFAVFTAIAIGLALPYLLLSIFPGAVKALPRPGAWMETFKQAMAFPLYATVGYLVWVLAGQTSDDGFLKVLFALTVIATGVWFYGRYAAPGNKVGRQRAGVAVCVALLALGAWLGWPRAKAPGDLVWQAWAPGRAEELAAAGRPVYVDFTARWCATCQANKQVVFGSDKVRAYLLENDVALLKADWTAADPRITEELAKWGRSAVPFNLVYLPGHDAPTALPELLTPGIVLEALGAE